MVTEKKSNRKANGLGCLAGGLVFCLLFPLCVFFFGWLSFALGMSCAFPSQCSAAATLMKGIRLFCFLCARKKNRDNLGAFQFG
ncbi:MAG: hypothetical protein DWQ54_07480 [Microcystis flos-aquae TF09]|uniref:Uncharacterized protein n=1 Tax=Microcystis flos-aquae TF09 TaxID=2060473 RepID=A0A3E0L5I5_9CHRO|nr:MAG: hypothetical protein DWQ54_07480 [Microcystis flos-aquae TF09]